MKSKTGAHASARVTDLRKAYPDLTPDKEYPPLEFQSLKGKVSAAEWEARVDCACAYRLVRHFGMDDLIYNHISARIPGTEEFLLNPFGLMYDEMCASSLIKVSLAGKVLWEPEFPAGLGYKFNPAGYVIHSAIHEARPELHCVLHTHSLADHGGVVAEEGPAADDADRDALRADRVPRLRGRGARRGGEGAPARQPGRLRSHDAAQPRRAGGRAHGGRRLQQHSTASSAPAARSSWRRTAATRSCCRRPRSSRRPTTCTSPARGAPYGLLEWPAMRRLADRIDPSYKN